MSSTVLYRRVKDNHLPQMPRMSQNVNDTHCSDVIDENGNGFRAETTENVKNISEVQENCLSDNNTQSGNEFITDSRDTNNNVDEELQPVLVYPDESTCIRETCVTGRHMEGQYESECDLEIFGNAGDQKRSESPIRTMNIDSSMRTMQPSSSESKTISELGAQTRECHCSCEQTSRFQQPLSSTNANTSPMTSSNHTTGKLHAPAKDSVNACDIQNTCERNENKEKSEDSTSISQHTRDRESKTCTKSNSKGNKKRHDSYTVEFSESHRTDNTCKRERLNVAEKGEVNFDSLVSELTVVDVASVDKCSEVSTRERNSSETCPKINVSRRTDSVISVDTFPNTKADKHKGLNYDLEYVNLTRRCDELIKGFQKQNQDYMDLTTWHVRLRRLFVYFAVFNFLFVGIVSILIIIVMRPLLARTYSGEMLQNVQKNLSSKVERIHGDYTTVTGMVNELMTRTKSVMQLTSDGQCSRQNSNCYLQWSGEGIYHQGSLRLSSSRDSIIATNGAFYLIYCKVQYFLRVNTTVDVKFQFEILHRQQTSSMPVYYAIEQLTAVAGSIRHEVAAQITLYLQPRDEIIVSMTSDQALNIARFPAAHALEEEESDTENFICPRDG